MCIKKDQIKSIFESKCYLIEKLKLVTTVNVVYTVEYTTNVVYTVVYSVEYTTLTIVNVVYTSVKVNCTIYYH